MRRPARAAVRAEVTRIPASGPRRAVPDAVAVEEPLELRVQGAPFAVLMRTPGDDRELTAGFLFAERVAWAAEDLHAIEPCVDAEHPHAQNVVNVTLGARAAAELERFLGERRRVTVNSACGVCGRVTIESLQVQAPFVDSPLTIARGAVAGLFDRLRARQTVFGDTGGLHAAGLFDADGTCASVFEDVGRHNAVDKVVGRELLAGHLPASGRVLAVSGRASFEIVQKAFLAGVPVVAAVSAPTSLAVQLAEAAGITLIAFVRDGGFNIYAHPERVRTQD
jgi:FdhD protein